MKSQLRRSGALLGACAVAAVSVAACGSSSSGSSSSSSSTGGSAAATTSAATTSAGSSSAAPAASSSALGTPKAATGKPVVFGMINLELNPQASFPEVRAAAEAAVKYVNAYKGGLDGHPIQLDTCLTDGSPATSAQCANKLVAQHPVAILGGADLSAANTLPIYKKAGLAYIGGMDLTPVESSAPNAVIFNDIAQSGNSDIGVYAVKNLHAKNVSVLALDNTQGTAQAKLFEIPSVTASGGTAKLFSLPPSQADVSSNIASAISNSPDALLLEDPSQCVAILSALKSLGNTKPVLSIDPCSAPSVVKAAAGGANGMYWFEPYQDLFAADQTKDVVLTKAILAKYAPANIAIDSPALGGLTTVMNVWSAFHNTPVSKLTSAYMLKTLKTGTHPAFLSTTYTCNGKAIVKEPAICSANEYLYQIKGTTPTLVQSNYTAGANIGG
ncbi:MAG TPA: ABC transporter substrate-binding protein [Solirubrobacteraceae bacterium]|nr:ABC transporter substrate-binding protein [Solirubrobacteraceae bacterium]